MVISILGGIPLVSGKIHKQTKEELAFSVSTLCFKSYMTVASFIIAKNKTFISTKQPDFMSAQKIVK